MATISVFETKTKFSEFLDRASKGEEIIITRCGKPVARLIGEARLNRDDIQRAAEGLEALQNEIASSIKGKDVVPWEEFEAFIEEGRR